MSHLDLYHIDWAAVVSDHPSHDQYARFWDVLGGS